MARRVFESFVTAVGGSVEKVRGTGEVLYRHPLMEVPARANGRKKDTTRHAIVWGRQLERRLELEGQGANRTRHRSWAPWISAST
jgi:hypothetical protein